MAERIIPKDFYVYAHLKATTKEVFYVGKGQGRRAWGKNCRNSMWQNTVKKHGIEVIVIEDGLQEWYAFELEQSLIALHGRRDLNSGTLVNFTDGGEGNKNTSKLAIATRSANMKSLRQNPIHRATHSKNLAARNKTAQAIEAVKKQWQCPERVAKASKVCLDRNADPAFKSARSKQMQLQNNDPAFKEKNAIRIRQAKSVKVMCMETGDVFSSLISACEWLKSMGRKTVSHGNISTCASGKSKSAYGYKWAYA